MTMFSSIASPGHRWKMFLPGAAATQGEVLSLVGAVALARSRWLSGRARGSAWQCRDRSGGALLRD